MATTPARSSSSPAKLLRASSVGGKVGDDASEDVARITWARAIGVFHLYVLWLIADLVGL
jgi:hypothetical protein|tara:strand:+ start:33 stop:212 length:180 start_codon:yes stop_codon:yes gene_type:complete